MERHEIFPLPYSFASIDFYFNIRYFFKNIYKYDEMRSGSSVSNYERLKFVRKIFDVNLVLFSVWRGLLVGFVNAQKV